MDAFNQAMAAVVERSLTWCLASVLGVIHPTVYPLCWRCSEEGITSFFAVPQLASLSQIMTHGGRIYCFNGYLSSRLAACLSLRPCASSSSTILVWSTARQSRCVTPFLLGATLARCPFSPDAVADGGPIREGLAKPAAPLLQYFMAAHNAAKSEIGSATRKLRCKRKCSHTTWLMILARKRYPTKLGQTVRAVISPDYSTVGRSDSWRVATLTVPRPHPRAMQHGENSS